MKEIKVLGPGCPRCEDLLNSTRQAVRELSLDCSIEKVADIQKIASFGVMMTPALVVDGQVKVTGRVPTVDDLKKLLA